MLTPITQRWTDYCMQITETARRFSNSTTSPNDEITSALHYFVASDPPADESELKHRMQRGDALQAAWKKAHDDQRPYSESEHHEPMPMPVSSMAEQAEQVRSKSKKSNGS